MEDQTKELVDVIEKKINASTEANTKLNSELADQVKALQAKHEELTGVVITNAEALAAINTAKETIKTVRDEIKAAAKQLSENYADSKFGPQHKVKLNTVGEMLLSTSITGTGVQPVDIKVTDMRIALPLAFQLCNVFSTTGDIIDASVGSEEGAVGGTAENTAKNQIDYVINGIKYSPIAYNGFVDVSRQMMKNLPYIENQIITKLNKKVFSKISTDVFNGSGSPDTSVLKGVREFATAWTTPVAYGSAYSVPTLYHVLLIGVAKSRTNLGQPDAIILTPNDAVGLKLAVIEKQINMPEAFMQNGQLFVSGVPIVEDPTYTAGEFLIGEFKNASNVALLDGYELYVDPYTGLKKNMVTILGEQMVTSYVAAADASYFIKGVIADCILALKS
jgi:hypothetical protein